MKKILWAVLALVCLGSAFAMDDHLNGQPYEEQLPLNFVVDSKDKFTDDSDKAKKNLDIILNFIPAFEERFVQDASGSGFKRFNESIVQDVGASELIKRFNESLRALRKKYEDSAAELVKKERVVAKEVEPEELKRLLEIWLLSPFATAIEKACKKHSPAYRNKLLEDISRINDKLKELPFYKDLLGQALYAIYRDPHSLSSHSLEDCEKNPYWFFANVKALTQGYFEELKLDFNCLGEEEGVEEPDPGRSCKVLKIKGLVPSPLHKKLKEVFNAHLKLAKKLEKIQKDVLAHKALMDLLSDEKKEPDEEPCRSLNIGIGTIARIMEMMDPESQNSKENRDDRIKRRKLDVVAKQIDALMEEAESIITELAPAYEMAQVIKAFHEERSRHQSQLKQIERLQEVQQGIFDRIIYPMYTGKEFELSKDQISRLQGIKTTEGLLDDDGSGNISQQIASRVQKARGIIPQLYPVYKTACGIEAFLEEVSQYQSRREKDRQSQSQQEEDEQAQLQLDLALEVLRNQKYIVSLIEQYKKTDDKNEKEALDEQIQDAKKDVSKTINALGPTYQGFCNVEAFKEKFLQHQRKNQESGERQEQQRSQGSSQPPEQQRRVWFQIATQKGEDDQEIEVEVEDAPEEYLRQTKRTGFFQRIKFLQKAIKEDFEVSRTSLQTEIGEIAKKPSQRMRQDTLRKRLAELNEEERLFTECCEGRLKEILLMIYKPGLTFGDQSAVWFLPDYWKLSSHLKGLFQASDQRTHIDAFRVMLAIQNMNAKSLGGLTSFFEETSWALTGELAEIEEKVCARSEIIYLMAINRPLTREQCLTLSTCINESILANKNKEEAKEAAISALDQKVSDLYRGIDPILKKLHLRYLTALTIKRFRGELRLHRNGEAKGIVSTALAPLPSEKKSESKSWFGNVWDSPIVRAVKATKEGQEVLKKAKEWRGSASTLASQIQTRLSSSSQSESSEIELVDFDGWDDMGFPDGDGVDLEDEEGQQDNPPFSLPPVDDPEDGFL